MRFSDVYYLTESDIITVHDAVLLEGEKTAVLKPNELNAVVMAVQASFDGVPLLASLAEVAAAYVYYLNRSHVFVDANKRTSLFSTLVFLETNGFKLDLASADWFGIVLGVADNKISQLALVEIFTRALGAPVHLES